jgi:hypothetical protein
MKTMLLPCSRAAVHLDEFGAGGAEERHAGLTGDRPREERLAIARRADEEDAARDARPDGQEALGLPQELDDLHQLFFRFVGTGDVGESGRRALRDESDAGRLRG